MTGSPQPWQPRTMRRGVTPGIPALSAKSKQRRPSRLSTLLGVEDIATAADFHQTSAAYAKARIRFLLAAALATADSERRPATYRALCVRQRRAWPTSAQVGRWVGLAGHVGQMRHRRIVFAIKGTRRSASVST